MSTEVDRLLLVFDADFKKLDDKLNKVIAKNKAAAKQVEESWAGAGISNALEKGFANLAEGAGEAIHSLPGIGPALSALGPAGLTAAAGLGAFAVAMEKTEKAVDYAAGIAKLSEEIGVSTTFLQQFNYAAHQSDVDVGAADAALKNLNATLGSVQGNLPRAKQLASVFTGALKLTPDQLRSFHDVGDFLPVLADRIKAAGTAAEQAAIAKKFGVEDLLPLLKQGGDAFRHLAQEALDLGIVLDNSTIIKAEEAKKKLAELDDVTKAKTMATFAQFADTLAWLKTVITDVQAAFLNLIAAMTNTGPLEDRIKDLQADIKSFEDTGLAELPGIKNLIDSYKRQVDTLKIQQGIQAILGAPRKTEGGNKPVVLPTAAKKRQDDFLQREDELNKQFDAAYTDFLNTWKDMRTTTEGRAEIQKLIFQAESDSLDAAVKERSDKIDAALKQGSITKAEHDILITRLGEVADEQKKALATKVDLDAIRTQQQLADERTQLSSNALEIQAQALQDAESLAKTQKDRRAIELRLLDLAEQKERLELQAIIDSKTAAETDKQIARAKLDALDQQHGLKVQQIEQQTAGPLEDYFSKLPSTVNQVDEAMQNLAVHGLQNVVDGLTAAITGTESWGEAVKNVLASIAADFIKLQLESALGGLFKTAANPFAGLLTAATGILSSPSGVALVGERGPELVNLPGGSQILSNSSLRNLGMGGASPPQVTVLFDNRGAVIWEQAARQLMAYADRAAAVGAVGAVQTARATTPQDLASMSARRLG